MTKLTLISKFMTSQTGKQVFTIHILPSILRSEGNQTITFRWLIKYNMINIILEKSCTKSLLLLHINLF